MKIVDRDRYTHLLEEAKKQLIKVFTTKENV